MGTKSYWVYILASRIGGTLYIGITSDLIRRVYQHKTKQTSGFTQRYDVIRLVHFEQFDDPEKCHSPRKAAEEMESNLENTND